MLVMYKNKQNSCMFAQNVLFLHYKSKENGI